MRKNLVITWLLILVLALCGGTATAAGTITLYESSTDVSDDTYIESISKYKDGLCVRTNKGVYSWTPGSTELELIYDLEKFNEEEAGYSIWSLSYTMEHDGKLLSYNRMDSKFYELSAEGIVATELKLDPTTLPGATGEADEAANLINNVVSIDGNFYVLARPSEQTWDECSIYEVNLQSGELTMITPKEDRIIGVSGYKDGKLLVTVGYPYNSRTQEEQCNTIRIFDLAKKGYEGDPFRMNQEWYNMSSAAYDPVSDYIYVIQGSRIMRCKFGEKFETVNYLPGENYYSETVPILVADKITFMYSRNLALYSINPDELPKTVLNVDGSVWIDETAMLKFSAEHPDVAINITNNGYYSMENLQTGLSSSEAPDIFTFSSYGNIDQLFKKGYAKDISSDQRLMDKVKRMHPQLQEVVLKDGKLFAFPISLYPQMWSYSEKMLEEAGLEYPETYSDFIDMVADWDEDIDAGSTEKITLMDEYYMEKNALFQMILSQYIIANENPDEPMKFDTPEFREVMMALERAPIKQKSEDDQQTVSSWTDYAEPIINSYGGLWSTTQVPKRTLTAPPKLSQSSETIIPADITLFVVNPNTDKLDVALEYINFIDENLQPQDRYMLYTDLTEPVENRYYQQNKIQSQKYLDELLAEEVTPENQRDHDERVAEQKKYLEEDMEQWRWEVSEDGIEQYHALVGDIKIMTSNLLYNSDTSEEFYKIIQRYQQKQLNLDQMIRELDQKSQMIFLETR